MSAGQLPHRRRLPRQPSFNLVHSTPALMLSVAPKTPQSTTPAVSRLMGNGSLFLRSDAAWSLVRHDVRLCLLPDCNLAGIDR